MSEEYYVYYRDDGSLTCVSPKEIPGKGTFVLISKSKAEKIISGKKALSNFRVDLKIDPPKFLSVEQEGIKHVGFNIVEYGNGTEKIHIIFNKETKDVIFKHEDEFEYDREFYITEKNNPLKLLLIVAIKTDDTIIIVNVDEDDISVYTIDTRFRETMGFFEE